MYVFAYLDFNKLLSQEMHKEPKDIWKFLL